VRHPVFARVYARLSAGMEPEVADNRRRLLAGLAGRVIEVGAGNGLNFRHYPPSVERLVAVEPEPYLRALAVEAARQAPVPVEVLDGTADALPVESGFDAGVASLVLCSVPDQGDALAELYRVIRPGGELRFYEHVLAPEPGLARVQRLVDPVWQAIGGGCHSARDTLAAIAAAGFVVDRAERFRFPDNQVPFITAPHVLGAAHRPAG
jgi:ubiquinone/menaquinone biosynthesis C-methylase UbiE